MPAHFFVYCVRIQFGHGSAVLSVHFSRIIARASVVSFSRIFALPFRLLSRMICGLFQTLSRAFLPPFKFFYCADCQSVFFRFVSPPPIRRFFLLRPRQLSGFSSPSAIRLPLADVPASLLLFGSCLALYPAPFLPAFIHFFYFSILQNLHISNICCIFVPDLSTK